MNYIARELVPTFIILPLLWAMTKTTCGKLGLTLLQRSCREKSFSILVYTFASQLVLKRGAQVLHSFSAPKTLIVIHTWNMVGIVTRLPYQKEAGCTHTTLINSHLILDFLISSTCMCLKSSLTCRIFGWSHLDYLLHQPTSHFFLNNCSWFYASSASSLNFSLSSPHLLTAIRNIYDVLWREFELALLIDQFFFFSLLQWARLVFQGVPPTKSMWSRSCNCYMQ